MSNPIITINASKVQFSYGNHSNVRQEMTETVAPPSPNEFKAKIEQVESISEETLGEIVNKLESALVSGELADKDVSKLRRVLDKSKKLNGHKKWENIREYLKDNGANITVIASSIIGIISKLAAA